MTPPKDRAHKLTFIRNLKMSRSAHAYVPGNTARFYDWLQSTGSKIPDGPPVWICGDCHLGNLGPLADAKGRVAIQIRDLDLTVIGNPAYDLIRLGLSLVSAARSSDLPGITTVRILEKVVEGYEGALAGESDNPKDKSHRPTTCKSSWKNPSNADGVIWRSSDCEPIVPSYARARRSGLSRLKSRRHSSSFSTKTPTAMRSRI